MTAPRMIAAGSALLDQLALVPDAFVETIPGAKGGMELIDHPDLSGIVTRLPKPPSRAPGGSAANTAAAASRLGLKSRLLTKVGSDDEGSFYRQALEESGVETTSFKVDTTTPTGSCLSLVTPDSERTLRTFLGASATLSPKEITEADFAGCTHAHIEGYLLFNPELMRHVLRTAKASGCTISIDLASPEVVAASRIMLPSILRDYADMVFANEDEAFAFAQTSDEGEALTKLADFCRLAVVKLGARGALMRREAQFVRVPAVHVDAIDTTGAGDYWAAGFLYGVLNDKSLAEAGHIGASVAAEVVQCLGAALADETWARLKSELDL